ncbi:MAG: thiolase family protein [Candidatus Marinimicrobia bacterium]|jgi:acetyl-CoA acyltransferase|nr:thiolase family protein [Candidatus Neomarinimicrobiota bacterium]MBT7377119.1 thiolase family protein [Candidatus Neomarinimicrobiota bacterium]
MSNEKYSVIIDGARSPIVLKNSPLLGMRSDDLAAIVIKELVGRNPEISKDLVDDLVVGCAFPEGPQGMLMAKGISILADLPMESAAKIVNRFCGSSMDAAHQVSQAVLSGDYECGIAAGVEDMFSVPMGGFNPSFNPTLYENEYYIGMGETAENLAQELDISRDNQEAFAMHSHEKALNAIAVGRFDNEIVPIEFNGATVSADEGPREPNLEKIKSLDPAFDADGSITAATSSPVSFGAASLLITSNTLAEASGVKAKFRIKSRAVAGVDWRMMGSGPLPATEKALSKAGLSMADIDTIELNEAFAAQSLYVIRKGGWDMDKINLNGGAIALGHPLGCSGARLLVTLMNVMEQNDTTHGLATMCIGSGQGIATIIERIN